MMKRIIIALLLVCFASLGVAKESSPQKQETAEPTEAEFMAGLLESNFNETPYTALVTITGVEKKGHEMLYPTFVFKCKVLETYKGKKLGQVAFWRGLEEPPQQFPIGKTFIVSLFMNKEGQYYLGDNGYDLPATEQLTALARELSIKKEKKKP